jgi:sugar transferase EpsL
LKYLVKRLLDIGVSLAALLLLTPLLFAVGVGVRYFLGSPVLFVQERPGLRGQLFTLYKFRTMREEAGPSGESLADSARLTPFGRWLRTTSLDELPELWNVLRGDMSLVGPRPLLPEYLPLYTPEQARRHEVRPGLTGWAQVHGRNQVDWEKRFALDVWYVENWSLMLDLKILLRSLRVVLSGSGINQHGSATMEPFRGSSG